MRKFFVLLIGLVLLVTAPIGTVAASSKGAATVHTKTVMKKHASHKAGVEQAQLNKAVKSLLGIRYRVGGTTTRGFDCSGFTRAVYQKMGRTIPHGSKSQVTLGQKVSKKNLKPGDLVFFITNGRNISHVGIYMGNGKFAHAARTGTTITSIHDPYYVKRYVTARRIIGV